MKKIKLEARSREESGKKVKTLRDRKLIPAVLYGHGVKNNNLAVSYHDFEKVYNEAGESTLIDLAIDGKEPVLTLIQEVQTDPVKNKYLHVDFYQVKLTEKIEAEIEFNFINVSLAVKDLAGILVKAMNVLPVKCFPQDLISNIDVDLSKLKTFEDHIYVKDLPVPEKIEILASPDEVVASVTPPRSDEELKELEAKPEAAAEAEVVGKEKEEGEGEGEKNKEGNGEQSKEEKGKK